MQPKDKLLSTDTITKLYISASAYVRLNSRQPFAVSHRVTSADHDQVIGPAATRGRTTRSAVRMVLAKFWS